jgi:hypothetical protein
MALAAIRGVSAQAIHQFRPAIIRTYISSGRLSRCAGRRRPVGKNKVGYRIAEKEKSWYESFFGEISAAERMAVNKVVEFRFGCVFVGSRGADFFYSKRP